MHVMNLPATDLQWIEIKRYEKIKNKFKKTVFDAIVN